MARKFQKGVYPKIRTDPRLIGSRSPKINVTPSIYGNLFRKKNGSLAPKSYYKLKITHQVNL